MSDVFKGQKLLRINLDTDTALTSGSGFKIIYKKPDSTTGSWDAQVDGTKVYVDCDDGKIDQAGVWEFQPYWTENSNPIYGDIIQQEFKEPLKSI